MAHLTNFSFEFFYEIFIEDGSLLLLYHGAKESKMTKTQIKGVNAEDSLGESRSAESSEITRNNRIALNLSLS